MIERLDRFMARANTAYYANHDPFADFTTAPEISQAFGEILGAWAVVVWRGLGAPGPMRLVEAGPGRGTLMADAVRAVSRAGLAADIHLIETSPRLRAIQRRLGPTFHDTLDTVPRGPFVLFANEFLDALPVRQRRRQAGMWLERYVADGGPLDLPTPDAGGGASEWSDAALRFGDGVAGRIAADGGAALLIDYGFGGGASGDGSGDSLQAIADGKPANPYANPGSADLTAHVDFAALAAACGRANVRVAGPVPQGPFLAALGLHQRVGVLARTRPAAEASAMILGAQRLTEPQFMGRLFQVLALATPGVALPGFDA